MAARIFANSPIAAKLFVIAFIVLGLLIPLSMLRVPFDVVRRGPNGETTVETHQFYALADDLDIQARLTQDKPRSVGIYQVPVYLVRVKFSGNFKLTEAISAAASGGTPVGAGSVNYRWKEARLRLPLSDVRSMREFNAATLGARRLDFGPALAADVGGVEAPVDLSSLGGDSKLPFSIEMLLAGSQAVTFLPSRHRIDAHGFEAGWQVLALNRDFAQTWTDKEVDATRLKSAGFGVGLYQSVDVYQRSERAVKYALLFISLTFLTFFAWELLGNIRVHAIQYLFIGLALSTFYLLLIALSEHLPFWLSYWLGAAALAALLGAYIAGALDSSRSGLVIALAMSLVYGLLYMLVLSESYALLMGAVALFVVLAAVMLATRKFRWDVEEAA